MPVSIDTRGGAGGRNEAIDMSIVATTATRAAGVIIADLVAEVLWPKKLFVERPARQFGPS